MGQVLDKLGLNKSSENRKTINKYIAELQIDINHWTNQLVLNKRTGFETPIENVFVENSTYKSHLKDKIIKYDLIAYRCAGQGCNLEPIWQGKQLVLQIDHINGINNDNRLSNLRFLCPNCHSQTITYAGGNAKNRNFAKHTCIECGNRCSGVSKSKMCIKCISTRDKKVWPDDQLLIKMIEESNINQVAKQLEVSFTGLKKRLFKISQQSL